MRKIHIFISPTHHLFFLIQVAEVSLEVNLYCRTNSPTHIIYRRYLPTRRNCSTVVPTCTLLCILYTSNNGLTPCKSPYLSTSNNGTYAPSTSNNGTDAPSTSNNGTDAPSTSYNGLTPLPYVQTSFNTKPLNYA